MDREFSDAEFMSKLQGYPVVRRKDFIDITQGSRPQAAAKPVKPAPKVSKGPSSAIAAPASAPAVAENTTTPSSTPIEGNNMLSDEAFWAALEEHLARSGKPAETRKLVATVKA